MLKSPPAHQQRLLASTVVPVNGGVSGNTTNSSSGGGGSGGEGNTRGSNNSGGSGGSSAALVFHREDASSCDADDEEFAGETGACGYDDDQPLDMSVRRGKDIEMLVGVKRGRDSDSGGECKRTRVSEGNKRKHLRKKRRDCGGSYNGGRPSVISFAGANGEDGGGSSSSSSGDEAARVFRRRRKRVWVKETELVGGFDVDEHFRRSLGAEWEAVVGKSNGVVVGEGERKEDVNGGGGSVRVIIEDSIKPSDVDDHFAKALGSETWSKIIASATAPSSPNPTTNHVQRQSKPCSNTSVSTPPRSPPPLPPPATQAQGPVTPVIPPTDLPPPPLVLSQPLTRVNSTGSSSSTISSSGGGSSYKIDAILGNTVKSEPVPVEDVPLPLVHRVSRDDSEI